MAIIPSGAKGVKTFFLALLVMALSVIAISCGSSETVTTGGTTSYKAVDTNQTACFDKDGTTITCPSSGASYYGQDAQYTTTAPSYSLNGGSTVVTDNNTGLMWEKEHHSTRATYSEASAACGGHTTGGYSDWRVPNIKELFTIAYFSGAIDGPVQRPPPTRI